MHRFLPLALDTAVAALALALVFWLLGRLLGWSRRRALSYYAMAVYLSIIFSLVGLPDIRYIRFQPHVNLKPFRYFFTDRTTLPNVLLFIPLGIFLTALWQRFSRGWRAMLFGLGVSLTIELLQIFTFRATDVNDLITNTLGTVLGWGLGRLGLAVAGDIHPSAHTADVGVILAVSFGFMVVLHPILADPIFAIVFA